MKSTTHQFHKTRQGEQTTFIGIGVNIGLVLVKGTAGLLGHSFALVADALESATDIITSLFVWAGLRTASKAPDRNNPCGHGKAEPLAAIIVALALVGAAIVIAVQSIQHIQVPHAIPAPFTLAVLGGVIVSKEILFRRMAKVGPDAASNAVKADAWHHCSDAITSLTAFVGISIALIGGPGYESADDWAALLTSGFIVYNAYHIFRPSFEEIMDEAPAGNWRQELTVAARLVPGVRGINKY